MTNEQAVSLIDTIRANVCNKKLSDKEFREFVRRSIAPSVETTKAQPVCNAYGRI